MSLLGLVSKRWMNPLLGPAVLVVRSQTISGNGGHDNHGRGEKVSDPKMKEIGD
jgi:hypothetical protein